MPIIETTFALSAPARRALTLLRSPQHLEYIAERFFDKIRNERYRDFAVAPTYFTTMHGYRQVHLVTTKSRQEKLENRKTSVTIKMLRGMKKLQSRGLSLTWQMEEILYFGFKEGLIINPQISAA